MRIRPLLAATATAMLLSTTSLSAQTDPVIDAIVNQLTADGYTHIEIRKGLTRIQVEATNPSGKVEQVFSTDGRLLKEEVIANGVKTERTFDANGNVTSEQTVVVADSSDDDGIDDDIDDGTDDDEDDDDGIDDDDDNDDNGGSGGNDDDEDDDDDEDEDDDDDDEDDDDDDDD